MRRITRGIDVSTHQGDIDWGSVRSNIDFAMLRVSFGEKGRDKRFPANLFGCLENRIPFGLYHYSYAMNSDEAAREAENFLSAAEGISPALPVFFDLEEKSQTSLPEEKQFAIAEAFLERIEDSGFEGGIYSFKNALEKLRSFDSERLEKRWIWLAQWSRTPSYSGRFDLWQQSSTGTVTGIRTAVDLNTCYTDFISSGGERLGEEIARLRAKLSAIAEIAKEQ